MFGKLKGISFFIKNHGIFKGGLLVLIFSFYNLEKDLLFTYYGFRRFFSKRSSNLMLVKLFDKKSFIISKNDKGLSFDIFKRRIREPNATKILRNIFDNEKKMKTFLDLGANIGYYDVVLGDYFKKIICVEPNKQCIKVLKKNLEKNDLQNKTEILNGAINYTEEKLFVRENIQFNLSTVSNESGGYKIESYRFDKLFKKYNPDFIKMDIEGFEMDLFLNLKKELLDIRKSLPKYIFIEIHFVDMYFKKNKDLLLLLDKLGYNIKYGIFEEKGPYYLAGKSKVWNFLNNIMKKCYIGSLNNVIFRDMDIKNFISKKKDFLNGKYGAIEFIFEKK
jgi:FkbM family methyltransferase